MTSDTEQRESQSDVRKDHNRFQDLIECLSSEERSALKELSYDPMRRRLPTEQALRLLTLGFAELNCGRLILTANGRLALAAMNNRSIAR